VGFYYSPLDWRFPGFFFPDLQRPNAIAMREQYHRQMQTLLSNYGKIDILWFDGGEADWLNFGGEWNGATWQRKPSPQQHYHGGFSWQHDQVYQTVRKLQPNVMLNGRADMPEDFHSREGETSLGVFDNQHPWELCATLAGAWGYQAGVKPKPLRDCIRLLVGAAGRDGNLLLNVGPRPDGRIEQDQLERLKEIGAWLGKYGESIYATRGGPFLPGDYGVSTCRDRTIYLHIFNWKDGACTLPKLSAKVLKATALTGGEVSCLQSEQGIELKLEKVDPDSIDTIIALELDGPVSNVGLVAVEAGAARR
jgi:alpha-L-fucosidase